MFYKPLADRWGRKKFLIINTFGMSLSMLLIFLSDSLWLYFLGACMIQFFIPHDMHVVYIMETAPSKHRARIYSTIKFFANMGVMLVPLLRRLLMHEASEWRNVFLIPAIVGIISSTVAIFTARETDAFIDSRIRFLGLTDEERAVAKKEAKAVAVSVIDNGPGIPKEIKSRVFDMFYTGENKVADSRRSLGLGLALCKSIINAHGGEITLTDNQPQGCNFTFTLPMEEVRIDE